MFIICDNYEVINVDFIARFYMEKRERNNEIRYVYVAEMPNNKNNSLIDVMSSEYVEEDSNKHDVDVLPSFLSRIHTFKEKLKSIDVKDTENLFHKKAIDMIVEAIGNKELSINEIKGLMKGKIGINKVGAVLHDNKDKHFNFRRNPEKSNGWLISVI